MTAPDRHPDAVLLACLSTGYRDGLRDAREEVQRMLEERERHPDLASGSRDFGRGTAFALRYAIEALDRMITFTEGEVAG